MGYSCFVLKCCKISVTEILDYLENIAYNYKIKANDIIVDEKVDVLLGKLYEK